MWRLHKYWTFVKDRRASFSFTLGSIGYGIYHFFNGNVLAYSDAYFALDKILGILGGRYLGILFVFLGSIKLVGLFTDNIYLKLPIYFALLFMWVLLGVCFLISFLQGFQNAAWVYCFMIAALSTSVIPSNPLIYQGEEKRNE